jgi:molybdate transport system permease protein
MSLLTPVEVTALGLSLRVAAVSVAASLPLAVLAARVLARRTFFGKSLLEGLLALPLVLPPVAVGYMLLLGFGRRGLIGGWLEEGLGISVAFTWKGAAIASAVVAFPLMVRAIRVSMESVDPKLESAARTLGARPLRVFLTVTLPLSAPGLLAGAILAFARSLGEFGATITFVSNIPGETQTLPLALYTLIQTPGGEAAAMRVAVISVFLAIGAILGSELLARRVARGLGG